MSSTSEKPLRKTVHMHSLASISGPLIFRPLKRLKATFRYFLIIRLIATNIEFPSEKIQKLQHALFLTNPQDDRANLVSVKGQRVPNTCEWIKKHTSYQSWLRGDVPLLWISGGPGKGKTMLSIFVTEELESTSGQDARLLYYFCDHQDEKRNNAVHILRGLLWQITRKPELRDCILDHFWSEEKGDDQALLSSHESLWRFFSAILQDQSLGLTFCVLDGLDECDDESVRWLIKKLIELFPLGGRESMNDSLRMMIISRDMPSLMPLLTNMQCDRMKLDPDHNEQVNEDIMKVISANIQKLSWTDGFSFEFEEEAQKILLERSEGTFLWVGCVMSELEKESTPTGIMQKLRSFPKGLNAIYKRMLLQIKEPERRRLAASILQWVALAASPLSLEELAAAVCTPPLEGTTKQPTDDCVTVIGTHQLISDQVKMCGPMLQIHGETVSLVHNSAREFLLRVQADENAALEELRIKPAEAHLRIASTCLECIKQSSLRTNALDIENRASWRESPLLAYAVVHWPKHARLSIDQGRELFSALSFLFEGNAKLWENWWKTCATCRWGEQEMIQSLRAACREDDFDFYRGVALGIKRQMNEEVPQPLHMACRYGLLEWVRNFLAAGHRDRSLSKTINAIDANGLDPLTSAVIGGHKEVVQSLIDYGANTNATTALLSKATLSVIPSRSLASYLRLCTKEDIVLTAKHTVLYRAALLGNAEIVRILLDSGASPNLKGWANSTPLHAVALDGNEDVMHLLLRYGGHLSVNTKLSAIRFTPLSFAVACGHHRIAQILLDLGADMHNKLFLVDPLYVALRDDASTQMIEMLLDHGARINRQFFPGGTPLRTAVKYSRSSTIKLLIARGAEINAKFYWKNPLHVAASESKRCQALQTLLECGADVNAEDFEGKIALHVAAENPDGDISVKLLLDHGVDANAKSDNGNSPLHFAAKNGNRAIIELLLHGGAEVNVTNKKGQTPLDAATAAKNSEAIHLLKEAGGVMGSQRGSSNSRSKSTASSRLSPYSRKGLLGFFSNSTSALIKEKAVPTNGDMSEETLVAEGSEESRADER
ncbi:MAG: hypothetical protein Q9227_008659 [Pyrenula ochraceoflavens]